MHEMKKLTLVFLALALVLGAAVSCRQVEKIYVKDKLEALLEDIEANYKTYTDEKWDEISDQWEKLIDDYEDNYDDYSAEDRKEISEMIGRYAAVSVKAVANELSGSVEEIAGMLGGFFGSLKESLDSLNSK